MSAPKGINDTAAILKNCLPNGIPMMVMQRIAPMISATRADSQPIRSIQRMLPKVDVNPTLYSTSLPKGQAPSDASLKHS